MTPSFEGSLGSDTARADSDHVGPDEAAGFIEGWLPEDERLKIEHHIDRCAECRKYISELAALSWTSGRRPKVDAHDANLERGTNVGRYVVDGWLGRGEMGIVYSAYDPKLHRKVALKMVDANVPGGTARLEREAQAMARLSHPNVVAIHDIGAHEGQLFIAMEFIEGVTLRSWLCDESRSTREILDAFIRAGRGLQAAHESGLIHRDFKPDNVLCGSSGRVCVSDFGLARATLGESSAAENVVVDLAAAAGSRSMPYLAGTPLYMAPEQYSGRAMDARSDQFSFSVALYQALYRQHPFAGKTFGDLAGAVTEGRVEEPRSRAEVPLHVHRAVLRGLNADPDKRFPSMSEYLQALSSNPSARRRRLLGAAAAGAVLLSTPLAARHWQTESLRACEVTAKDELSAAWGDARKGTIRNAFLATGKPLVMETWSAVERALDEYAHDWSAARVDACTASRGSGKSAGAAASLAGARMACLDDRLKEMAALTEVFTHADPETVGQAPGGARALAAPARCNDTSVLLSRVRPPPDAVAGEVAAIRDRLARAEGLRLAGHYKEEGTAAEQALRAAENIDYPVVLGEALVRNGIALQMLGKIDEANAHYRRALAVADAAGDDRTRADALTWLLDIAGGFQAKYELAALFNDEAKAAIARAGGDAGLEGMRRFYFAIDLEYQSKYEDALREFDAALLLLERGFGKTSEPVLKARVFVVKCHLEHGDYDEARSMLPPLLSMSEEALGPRHFMVSAVLRLSGYIFREQLRFEEAERHYRRALEIAEDAMGPDGLELVALLEPLGSIANEWGRYPQAMAYFQRAIDLREKRLGPDEPLLVVSLAGLGEAYLSSGDPEKAIPILERAVRVHGDEREATVLGWAKFNLAKALAASGRDSARARHLAAEAQTIYRNAGKTPLNARNAAAIDQWLLSRAK